MIVEVLPPGAKGAFQTEDALRRLVEIDHPRTKVLAGQGYIASFSALVPRGDNKYDQAFRLTDPDGNVLIEGVVERRTAVRIRLIASAIGIGVLNAPRTI